MGLLLVFVSDPEAQIAHEFARFSPSPGDVGNAGNETWHPLVCGSSRDVVDRTDRRTHDGDDAGLPVLLGF